MKLSEIKEMYSTWNLFESEPTEELQEWHTETLNQRNSPDSEVIQFAYYVIDDFHVEKSAYWIDWAIMFIGHTKGSAKNIEYLEKIITDLEKYGVLTSTLGKAASRLGDIAPYPNEVLRKTIELDIEPHEDWGPRFIPMLRASAYGAYITTVTDFQTGLDAGRGMKASGEIPTVEKAEAFITKWHQENSK